MKARRAAAALLACAAAFAAACARQTVVIENRYAKGQELRYRLVTKGAGTTSMTGLPGQAAAPETPITLDMELVYRTVVGDVDAQGNAEVETFFERYASLNESGAFKVRIEADGKGARVVHGETVVQDAPGLDGLRAFFTAPMAVTVDKRGRVLSETAPGGGGAVLSQMDLGIILKQGQFLLPEGPVAAGHSWSEKRAAAPGAAAGGAAAAGALTMDTRYTLVRVANRKGVRCAEISVRGEMDVRDVAITPPGPAAHALRMKTVFDHLKQSSAGTIYFDLKKGRLVEMHLDTTQDVTVTTRMEKEGPEVKLTAATKMKTSSDLTLSE